jgi:hypothetical protein
VKNKATYNDYVALFERVNGSATMAWSFADWTRKNEYERSHTMSVLEDVLETRQKIELERAAHSNDSYGSW